MGVGKMPTHYEVLGISAAADAEEIRVAYRRLTRTLHPDAGGGRQQWDELREAFRVLSNPKLRAQYDRGERVQADSALHEARLGAILEKLAAILGQVLLEGELDLRVDFRLECLSFLNSEKVEVTELRKKLLKKKATIDKQYKRWRRKSDKKDFVRYIFDQQLIHINAKIVTFDKHLDVLQGVEEILNDYDYTADKAGSEPSEEMMRTALELTLGRKTKVIFVR